MKIPIANIMQHVCECYEVEQSQILQQCRFRELVEPRHLIMYMAKTLGKHSIRQISFAMQRDRQTVYHGIGATQDHIDTVPAFKEKVESIISLLDNRKAAPPPPYKPLVL